MKRLIHLSILLLLGYLQCNAQCDGEYFIVGKGGGFAGTSTFYKIMPDGNVLKGRGSVDITYSHQGKVKKSKIKNLFNELNNLKTEPFSHPGNIYYFLVICNSNQETKYTWGANDFDPPKEIQRIFDQANLKLTLVQFKEINQ